MLKIGPQMHESSSVAQSPWEIKNYLWKCNVSENDSREKKELQQLWITYHKGNNTGHFKILKTATRAMAAGSQRLVTWCEGHPEASYRQQQHFSGWAAQQIKISFPKIPTPCQSRFIKAEFNFLKAAGQGTAHLGKKITCKAIYF